MKVKHTLPYENNWKIFGKSDVWRYLCRQIIWQKTKHKKLIEILSINAYAEAMAKEEVNWMG